MPEENCIMVGFNVAEAARWRGQSSYRPWKRRKTGRRRDTKNRRLSDNLCHDKSTRGRDDQPENHHVVEKAAGGVAKVLSTEKEKKKCYPSIYIAHCKPDIT